MRLPSRPGSPRRRAARDGALRFGAALALFAGARCPAPGSPGPAPAPAARPAALAPCPAAAPPREGAPSLSDAGLGDVRLDAPLPARLLAPASDPIGRYMLGFHADAQTHEGFRLPGLPARVLMEGKGPFTRWFDDPKRKDDPPPNPATRRRLAEAALAEARAGAKVGWIVVDGPGPRTATGIGVGSTLAEVMSAHPSARLAPLPPTFGKDECMALLAPLQRVQVYFADCRVARAGGRVTRVTIFSTDKK